MKIHRSILAITIALTLSGNTFAASVKDRTLLSIPAEVVFGIKLDDAQIEEMADKKKLPADCRKTLVRMTDGVKLTGREEFRKWAVSNKAGLQSLCKKKKLTKEECMRMLVRFFTA